MLSSGLPSSAPDGNDPKLVRVRGLLTAASHSRSLVETLENVAGDSAAYLPLPGLPANLRVTHPGSYFRPRCKNAGGLSEGRVSASRELASLLRGI